MKANLLIKEDKRPDYDKKLLMGLEHVEWSEIGTSADKTRYGASNIRPNEHKKIHKGLVR